MKPLKILLGNNTLSLLAGTEMWVKTLALQLKKMGHVVHAYSPELGVVARDLEVSGIKCHSSLSVSGKPFSFIFEEVPDLAFDIIIANHYDITNYLREKFPNTPIISVIHGIMWESNGRIAPEHPAIDANVDQFVAVSEEVQTLLQDRFGIKSMIVRNFFDLKQLKVKRPISLEKPKVILFNSNYATPRSEDTEILRKVAKHFGARLVAVGQNFNLSNDILPALNDADIVVGMGRSVLEGVAAGRIGIVHGRWGTGGVITEQTVEELRSFNFSGRNNIDRYMTADEMIETITTTYANVKTHLGWGKWYMETQHDAANAADTFVQLSRSIKASYGMKIIDEPKRILKIETYDDPAPRDSRADEGQK